MLRYRGQAGDINVQSRRGCKHKPPLILSFFVLSLNLSVSREIFLH